MDFLLTLSSGQRMLSAAIDALSAGMPVVQSDSPERFAVESELTHRLSDLGWTIRSAVAGGIDGLAHALGLSSMPPPDQFPLLATTPQTVVMVSCLDPEITDYVVRAARLMSQKPRPRSLALWLIAPPADRLDARQFRLHLDEHLTPGEIRAFGAMLFVDRAGPGPTHYWEAVCREVSGPDFRLLQALSQLPTSALLDMPAALCAIQDHPAIMSTRAARDWPCSIALARRAQAGDDAARTALDQRIWRAQLQELLPAIEGPRAAFLRPYAAALKAALHKAGLDSQAMAVDEVEWGQAWHYLRGAVPASAYAQISRMRHFRNVLAHGGALCPADLRELAITAQAAFRQSWGVG